MVGVAGDTVAVFPGGHVGGSATITTWPHELAGMSGSTATATRNELAAHATCELDGSTTSAAASATGLDLSASASAAYDVTGTAHTAGRAHRGLSSVTGHRTRLAGRGAARLDRASSGAC
jgi:hypothetical protein